MTGEIDWQRIGEDLRRPFPKNQEKRFKGKGNQVYTYVDARDIQDRLDEVVGPGNWECIPHVIDVATGAVQVTLRIHGVSKGDIGYPNQPVGATTRRVNERTGEVTEVPVSSAEYLKEAVSDGLKRAAVQWGIARYLYPGDRPMESFGPQVAAEAPTAHGRAEPQARREDRPQVSAVTDMRPQAGSDRPSTAGQHATIERITRALGDPFDDFEVHALTQAEAQERIAELSTRFNQIQQAKKRGEVA
jgi:hypothetical protein